MSDLPTTSNGKIARLPARLREEVNRRLHDGETGPQILAWLNATPEAQEVCRKQFDSEPVSPQNLSAWRAGGFQKWLTDQKALERTRERAAHSRALAEASGGNLSEGVLAQLTGELMEIIEEFSLLRESGGGLRNDGDEQDGEAFDPKMLAAVSKALVSVRAKELETQALALKEKQVEQSNRDLDLREAAFHMRFAETFLKFFDEEETRRIATSGAGKETKVKELVQHWFGAMPEGIGPPGLKTL